MTEKTSLTTTNIQVFYPSWEEFQNFTKYVESIECQDAQKGGIAKIIPPPEWTHKNLDLDNLNLNIPKPIWQKSKGKDGVYVQSAKMMKSMTVCEFKQFAESDRYNAPTMSIPDLENKYWKEKNKTTAIYGADVSGTLFSNELKEWNMNSLGSILDIINDYGTNIEGVNTPFLYFGMYKSTFAWHTKDMDIYSLNYVHMGAAKQWYSISPKHGRKFESLVKKLFLDSFETCPAFLRHKTVLLSPNILETHSIPYNKARKRITWTPNSIRDVNNFPLFQKYLVNLSPKGAKGPVAKNWEIDKFLERHALFPDKEGPSIKKKSSQKKNFRNETNQQKTLF